MKKIFGIIAMVAITATTMFMNADIAEAKYPPPPQDEWLRFGDPVPVTVYISHTDSVTGITHTFTYDSWDCQGWFGSC